MCFYFLYLNPTFKILKMKTKYKFLNQTSFFFGCGESHQKLKMKTKKKKNYFFQLTKQPFILRPMMCFITNI